MNKPDFIGIGPGKSGSTWLYHILREHPQVGMASSKETQYFNDYYSKGGDWYSSFFSECNASQKIGEISNTYIFSSEAASRMAKDLPDVRLISILRNPIDRAFSHFLFLVRNGAKYQSFEECIEDRPDILSRGKYFQHLSIYFSLFSEQQIKVALFNDMKNKPAEFVKDMYEFIGVDSEFSPATDDSKRLPASKPRNRLLARTTKQLALLFREAGMAKLVTRIKTSSISKFLYKPYEKYPEITSETRRRLEDYFYEDTRQLSLLLKNPNILKLWFPKQSEPRSVPKSE